MKKHPQEKGKWIFEKLGFLPYNLVEKNKNKTIRKLGMILVFI